MGRSANDGCRDMCSTSSKSASTAAPRQDVADVEHRGPSMYRKRLPVPPATASFESDEGQRIFALAMAEGGVRSFFGLVSQFRTQNDPAYCGLSTLVMALNALGIDSERTWKGPWRWFHEDMLSCCVPLEQVKKQGITLEELACLAECNGARTTRFERGDDSMSLEAFRADVEAVCRAEAKEQVLVANYSRKEFEQTGDGHFSPIGGYCKELDVALILDVARFKLPPHWVPVERLWLAMRRLDPGTGAPRGYVILEPSALSSSVIFTFRTKIESWPQFQEFFTKVAFEGLACCDDADEHKTRTTTATASSRSLTTPGHVVAAAVCCGAGKGKGKGKGEERPKCADDDGAAVRCFLKAMPADVATALTTYEEAITLEEHLPSHPRDHQRNMESIHAELAESCDVFRLLRDALAELGRESQNAVLSCMVLLAAPGLPEPFKRLQDVSALSPLVRTEVATLRRQMELMMKASSSTYRAPASEGCAC